jgi:shikimate kinase
VVGGDMTGAGVKAAAAWIEIAGVAGSGKSTLTDALAARSAAWHLADSLHTRRAAHWPYVLHALPEVARMASLGVRVGPPLTWDEVKFVIYVSEWERYLRADHGNGHRGTVLDQGPLFALARLLWTEKPLTRTPTFEAWVEEMLDHWSRSLAAIVWLDAPEDVLLERINGRTQQHEAKGATASAATDLLRRHRAVYDRLLGVIERLGRPRVVSFDTGVASAAAIADAVSGFIGLAGRNRGRAKIAQGPAPERAGREVVQ